MIPDVAIVGGGVVGLCVAHACASKGMRVVVVERGAPEREGCSFANAGMIVPSHVVPLASPGMVALALRAMWNPESPFHLKPRASLDLLAWGWLFRRACTQEHVMRSAPLLRDLHCASRTLFEQWAAQWDDGFGFVESGMLVLCRTEHGLAEEAHAVDFARGLGVAAEVLTAKDVAALEPAIRMTIAGAVHFPGDARLVPGRLMAALQRETVRLGVDVRHGTEVRRLRVHGNRLAGLETDTASIQANEYVLCAGMWSMPLAKQLGLALPMQAGKGYSLTLDAPPGSMCKCALLSEARAAVTPMGSALRFGGTMEITGIEETVEAARVRGIVKSIDTYFPDVTPSRLAAATVRTGLRPCSPDGLPYVGPFARYANVSAATGHAMMGVSLAPITGRLIAQVLSGETTAIPIAALSPDRFMRSAAATSARQPSLTRV